MKILKVKEKEVDRCWNGPVSLSQKVKATCIKKGYRNVQINGSIYSVNIKNIGVEGMSIAWLGGELGRINPIGKLIKKVSKK
jgi:hypothetical protein